MGLINNISDDSNSENEDVAPLVDNSIPSIPLLLQAPEGSIERETDEACKAPALIDESQEPVPGPSGIVTEQESFSQNCPLDDDDEYDYSKSEEYKFKIRKPFKER